MKIAFIYKNASKKGNYSSIFLQKIEDTAAVF
jgi:hypothetical protein